MFQFWIDNSFKIAVYSLLIGIVLAAFTHRFELFELGLIIYLIGTLISGVLILLECWFRKKSP